MVQVGPICPRCWSRPLTGCLFLWISLCGLCLLIAVRLHAAIWEEGRGAPSAVQGEPKEVPLIFGDAERCPVGDRRGMFHQPGIMEGMFEQLTSRGEFTPVVLSNDPWLVQLDTFLSAQECMELINEVNAAGYHDSLMWSGDPKNQVLWRNSSTFLCQDADAGYPHCGQYSAMTRLRERMASVLGVDGEHGDGLAVLRYNEGGYYTFHHDYIPEQMNPTTFKNCGPRVLTFMVYLTESSDEDGGETNFFKLGLKVLPKQGRAVIWPDVYDDSPLEKDDRTAHEAMRVHRGAKVCATQWFYQYHYSSNRQSLCCD